jgi:NADH:ubiquinone oxidoreductase subunit H
MVGKVRRWDVFVLVVAFVVAFVVMFWHADKLTSRMQLRAGAEEKNFTFISRWQLG